MACKARRGQAKTVAAGNRRANQKLEAKNQSQDVLEPDAENTGLIVTRGRSARDRVGDWAAMRALDPSLKDHQIAEKLGIAPRTLAHHIDRGIKEGWLRFSDPMARIQHELVPKTIDNLSQFLDEKDKTVTIEMAKGTLFPQFKEQLGIHENQQIMALRIEMVGAPETSTFPTGKVVGTPKFIDIEAMKHESEPESD